MAETARLLIVNADDYGLTPGVSEGILRAHRDGVVTSTSALAVAPAFGSTAPSARDSGIGVGVHLCLVGEDPPLLSATEIPSLVDRRGRFPRSWRQLSSRVATGRVDGADLTRELDAQIGRVIDAGIRPTHLDSHQHTHLLPAVARVVVALADRHHIGAVRLPWSSARGPRGVAVRSLGRRLAARLDRAGLVHPDRFAGLDRSGLLDAATLAAELDLLLAGTGRTMELGTHPGARVDPERARYDWGFRWAEELDALCAAETRRCIEGSGVALGTFAQLGVVA